MKNLTNSEMKEWRSCHRKWYLSYYRKLARDGKSFNNPLSIGTRVHDALSAYYDPNERKDPMLVLAQSVDADLAKYPACEKDIRAEADLCDAMLSGYLQWVQETGVDAGLRIVAAEGARVVPLAPNDPGLKDVNLLSKLDVRVLREFDGARLALEHKTVGDLSTPLQTLKLDTQLLTEHLVEYMALKVEGKEEEAAKGVLYNMLRKVKRTARAKPPFYGRETVPHNLDELRNHWKHVVIVAHQILAAQTLLDTGVDHNLVCEPNPTRDCKWDCPFFKVCVMFDDGSDVEGALRDLYVTVDPLERYADLLAAEINADGVGLLA